MSERVRAFYHRHSHARQYQECAELAAAMLRWSWSTTSMQRFTALRLRDALSQLGHRP